MAQVRGDSGCVGRLRGHRRGALGAAGALAGAGLVRLRRCGSFRSRRLGDGEVGFGREGASCGSPRGASVLPGRERGRAGLVSGPGLPGLAALLGRDGMGANGPDRIGPGVAACWLVPCQQSVACGGGAPVCRGFGFVGGRGPGASVTFGSGTWSGGGYTWKLYTPPGGD